MTYPAVKEKFNNWTPKPEYVAHGGDVDSVAAQFGVSVAELVDFSANINPLGPPSGVLRRLAREAKDTQSLLRYPDTELSELRLTISEAHGIDEMSVVIANGASALIDATIRAVKQRTGARCILPVPGFSEYRRALDAAGYRTVEFLLHLDKTFQIDTSKLAETIALEGPQLFIHSNPHNPSGLVITREVLQQLLRAARSAGTIILLDEAFIDYLPAESLTRVVARSENLIVLRSLTKFYGMPALRVGYGVAPPAIARAIRAQIPTWPVTTLAVSAAIEALRDAEYRDKSREANIGERTYLARALTELEFRVFPSAANFLFMELPRNAPPAWDVRTSLIKDSHIIVRDCSNYEGLGGGRHMRVAVRSHEDDERLINALRAILTSRG